ncbi:MAG TPA: hypothetical protein ENI85_14650 [Deltaproteobacteria bacterium]|nr:hypothetical protein [Deltaproteobacteria bacterium]
MSRTVYSISILLHALWMLTASPGFADGSSGRRDDDNRWIPSWSLVLGFTSQEHNASERSSQFPFGFASGFEVGFQPTQPTPFPGDPAIDNRVDQGDNYLNSIHVGGSLALETPRLGRYGPRLFIEGEIEHVSSQTRSLTREGRPGKLFEDPDLGANFSDQAITGQGAEVLSDAKDYQIGASIGLSYPIQIGDLRFAIRPSARYLRQKFIFRGLMVDAFRQFPPGAPPTREITLRGSESLEVHALGPGLELEFEAVRIESLLASIYVSGGAYRVLSDRDLDFRARGRDNLNQRDFQAEWTAEIEPWIYRAGVGFRVRWMGIPAGWIGRAER